MTEREDFSPWDLIVPLGHVLWLLIALGILR